MEGEGESPEYSGSFLFLVDLSLSFRKSNYYRESKSVKDLLLTLEGLALMLTGYYSKKPEENKKIEGEVRKEIIKLKGELDKVLRAYGEGEDLEIPKDLWLALFDLEATLRGAWKRSGLQMSLRPQDDLEDF